MITKTLMLAFIIAFSVLSSVLYLVPLVFRYMIEGEHNAARQKLDKIFNNIIGIGSIISAALSIVYFWLEYAAK